MAWMSRHETEALVSIWFHPRGTIRDLLDENRGRWLAFLLVLLFGISFTMDQISFGEYGDWYSLSFLLGISVPIGLPVGLLMWLLYGGLFWGIGRLLGGTAAWMDVMTAVAWAFIPYTAKLLIWLFRALSFGEETFTLFTPNIDSNFSLLILYFLFLILDVVLTMWFYALLILIVSEAHQMAVWKGALTVVSGIAALWLVLKYLFHTVIMPF